MWLGVDVPWGSVAEWVSGIGALVASGVALYVSHRAQKSAEEVAREARRAAARDRTSALLVQLVHAVESDIAASESSSIRDMMSGTTVPFWSAEGAALCRALWGHRNLFGTTWHCYCEEDQSWTDELHKSGLLFPRMREELQTAIDSLDYEDRAA